MKKSCSLLDILRVETWPLTSVGKIDKKALERMAQETFDTDPPFCKEQRYFQAECYVLKQDRYQIEMLTNLDKIPEV